MNSNTREAVVTSKDSSFETIASYLPANYEAVLVDETIHIVGHDNAGWTLDDYVIPRLASGLHGAIEIIPETERKTIALIVPVEGPVEELGVVDLEALQTAVGGWVEALPIPSFIVDAEKATAYINEEWKFEPLPFNGRATDFLVPGVGLFVGDYIAGPLVLAGFDPETGEHAELPESVIRRIRKIEAEAS